MILKENPVRNILGYLYGDNNKMKYVKILDIDNINGFVIFNPLQKIFYE